MAFNETAILNGQEQLLQSELLQNSIAGGFQYKKQWNNHFKTIISIYETDYELEGINADVLQNQFFSQKNIVSETGLKLRTYYKLNDRLNWQNGYQFTETKVTNSNDIDVPRFRNLIGEVVREHNVFSSIKYTSKKGKTNFNSGIRINYIDKFNKFLLEPRLSFNHRFLKYFTIELLGEFKHQNISQIINFQNDFLGIERRRWQLFNENDIPVITSNQVSAGIQYNKKGWLLSTDVFLKKVRGITARSQGFQNQFEFALAIGDYEALGADILIRKKITNFNIWLSYSFLNSTYTFQSLSENNFPSNLDIPHTITVGLNYIQKHFKFSSGFNWRTGKPTTTLNTNNPITNELLNFNSPNNDRLNSFMRLDASLIYQFNLGNYANADFGVSVWNILNTQNTINNFFRINEENQPQEFFQNALNITPNMTLKVYF